MGRQKGEDEEKKSRSAPDGLVERSDRHGGEDYCSGKARIEAVFALSTRIRLAPFPNSFHERVGFRRPRFMVFMACR